MLATVKLTIYFLTALIVSTGRLESAFNGDIHIHDPSFIKSGKCYYIFSTTSDPNYHHGNVPIREVCNDKITKIAALFDITPKWIQTFTKVQPSLWAPDINLINGKYYVYYVGSSWGSRNSVIALATSTHIQGPYVDEGEVIHTSDDLQYNAIDPEIAWTIENGKPTQLWLIFGSYWSGIKAHRLDPKTGKLSEEDKHLYSLASRNGAPIEASSHAYRNGFYYLFVSFDICCRADKSTYRVMVGRSQHITGPYVGRNGVDMMKGGGTQILATNGKVHGPGGEDVYLDNGIHRMIYHWYNMDDLGKTTQDSVNIVDLIWSEDGWPSVGPQSKLNYTLF